MQRHDGRGRHRTKSQCPQRLKGNPMSEPKQYRVTQETSDITGEVLALRHQVKSQPGDHAKGMLAAYDSVLKILARYQPTFTIGEAQKNS